MYPSIDVNDLKISQTRRIVLYNYNAEMDTIDFRHYAIDVKVTGVSKGVRNIINEKELPDLSQFGDISEYISRYALHLFRGEGHVVGKFADVDILFCIG
jgi:ribosome biogenesis protein SSF1/2